MITKVLKAVSAFKIFQFFTWFAKVEAQMEEEQEASYR